MSTRLAIRHAEAFADEERAPLIAALWSALALLVVVAVLFGA